MKKKISLILLGLIICCGLIYFYSKSSKDSVLNTVTQGFIENNTDMKSNKIKFFMDETQVRSNKESNYTTLMYHAGILNKSKDIIHIEDIIYIIPNQLKKFAIQETKSNFGTNRYLIPNQVLNMTLHLDLLENENIKKKVEENKDKLYIAIKVDGSYYYYKLNSNKLPNKDSIEDISLQKVSNSVQTSKITKKYGINKNRFYYKNESLDNVFNDFISELDTYNWELIDNISKYNKVYIYQDESNKYTVEITGIKCNKNTYPETGSYIILGMKN
ncbi:MAG: hypothetical protein FH761_02230 [Firmicutes bacterium]|nr:hypothetical protein [Bacillota bacterium]